MRSRKRLLLVAKILYKETDEDNAITFSELMECLDSYGCKADRKTLYRDIEAIRETLFPVRYVVRKGYYAEKKGHGMDGNQ